MPQPVLSVERLRIRFPGAPSDAVSQLSFSLQPGKTLAVVGESGSGKSLTALALMDLLPPQAEVSGDIVFSGRKQARIIRGSHIGMVFQEPMSALNPVMPVGEQLAECLRIHTRHSRKSARAGATDWLRRVRLPEPEQIYHRYPHQLSGGQKQRVVIAMAMCNHPAVLIADEPTTALDVTVQQEIILLMRELQLASSTAMLFITHDLSLAAAVADDVLVMRRGEAMEYGPANGVLRNPQHPYTRQLLNSRPSGDVQLRDTPVSAPSVILEATALDVWFATEKNWLGRSTGYFKAVDNVSFTVTRGEILGIAGESGSGKSTLSRSLMGLVPITAGSARFQGTELAGADRDTWMQVRRRMQLIFQDPFSALNPRHTIGQILTEPLRIHHIVPERDRKHEACRLLDLVQLPRDAYHRYPHQFSGGQKQRIGIARALAVRPELLICDESVSALDVSIQAQILKLLKDLQSEFGLTYLFISHDLSVIRHISDHVLIMQQGRIVEQGATAAVFDHPQHAYTQKLLDAVPRGLPL